MAKRTAGVRMVKRRARPAPGRLARFAILLYWLLAITVIVFSVLLTALRLWGLPAIEAERERLVAFASEAIGVPVRIDNLRAGWQGINPRFEFFDVRIAGADGETRLTLPRVEAVVSWLSLAVFDLRLARLQIEGPNLVIERDAGGRLSVAGIALGDSQGGESPAADWLLRQHRIVVTDGELTWIDRQRPAPPLHLNDIVFRLDNIGPWHRFALRGTPPSALASPLDLRGSLFGFTNDGQGDWRGEIYVDVDRVALDAWQQWVNAPFELRSGGAGVRAWVDIERSGPVAITADLRLAGAELRLSKTLPLLSVDLLAGRVGVHREKSGFRVDLSRLQLHTTDGIHVDPVDAELAWQFGDDGSSEGHVEVARIDLGTLARVAEFLPLDAGTRGLLVDYQPAGRLANLRASWLGKAAGLETYSLSSDFEDLGVRARGRFPGIQGLSGNVEANERWGRLFLSSGPSGLELPAVFPEPLMAFDSLAGGVRWTRRDQLLEVELQALNFAGIDAVGTARGRYEYRGDGPGYLDLSAELTRAEAPAVWRYLPHVVPQGTRGWLHQALRGGVVDHAELRLEGELAQFPFDQGDGTFLVNARVRNATLAFQPGWPAVESLDADLRFAGSRMEIVSRAGSIQGVPLRRTVVVLPNLAGFDPVLRIDGGAVGSIPNFLAFLDASPVGNAIGGFYRDWQAEGEAELTLGLSIPLARPAETGVEGGVEFRDARIKLLDFLPAVNHVRGKLAFSEKGAEARDLRGDLLGSPVRVTVASGEGKTEVRANGALLADAAYRHYGWGWLPYLGGETAWEAVVRVPADGRVLVDVSSDLVGIASSLASPLNKAADDSLPLRVGYQRAASGDRLETTLGEQIAADLRGQLRGGRWQIARGAVAVGEPLALPAQGFEAHATLPSFDADFWQRVLRSEGAEAPEAAEHPETDGWPLEAWPKMRLRFATLRYAERDFNEVLLEGGPLDARLRGRVEAKEALGTWAWRPSPSGPGQLSARLQRLVVPAVGNGQAAPGASGVDGSVGQVVDAAVDTARAVLSAPGELVGKATTEPPAAKPDLPAAAARPRLPDLDLQADDARVGAMGLGRVELVARNVDDNWLIDRFVSTAPDGDVTASGGHYNHGEDETRLSIGINARNLGAMLERLGYGDAVGSGNAHLGGVVRWSGGITDFAPARLGGDVVVHAEKGRFRSLDNRGARLLGLLSLQNLPRRLLFDFGDVVSEGIAFDSIDGRFIIADGVMKTEGFRIDSPSGRVLMAGDIDIGRETQDLRLAIRPAVGSTVALGAAIFANPIAGVATLLAQKLFRDPLDKAFAVEYAVRGPWSEPQVERIGQVGGAAPGGPPGATP